MAGLQKTAGRPFPAFPWGARLVRWHLAAAIVWPCVPVGADPPADPYLDDADTIALWHFDGNGANSAAAASSTAIVGTDNGAVIAESGGRFGGALHVDRGRAFIGDGAIPELDATIAGLRDFTIELWVKPAPADVDGSSPTAGLLEHYSAGQKGWRGFDLRIDNLAAGVAGRPTATKGLAYFRSGDFGAVNTGADANGVGLLAGQGGNEVVLTADQWHHVAVTRRNTSWTLWIDGQVAAQAVSTWSVPDSPEPLIFGAVEGFQRPLSGWLDEVRISRVARSFGEEPPPPAAPFVPDPRPAPHLFLDDYEIASWSNLTRVLHQPVKRGVVVDADRPWEDWCADFPVVLRDHDGFHMFYRAIYREGAPPAPDPSETGVVNTCYAFSQDGLTWTKPSLGLREVKGTWDNNVFDRGGVSVAYWQPHHPDPACRYLFQAGYTYKAPEVLRGWVPYGPGPSRGAGLNYEPHRDLFAAYAQTEFPRTIYRHVTSDLLSWTNIGKVLEADAIDHHVPTDTDEFYGMCVRQDGTLTIGFLQVFHTDRTDPEYTNPAGNAWRKGVIDIQIVASRDGVNWTRVAGRRTWLPLGSPGDFDDGMVFVSTPGIRVGNEQWFYYGAWDGDHLTFTRSGVQFEYPLRRGRCGLATLRYNGYVSLRAGPQEGRLTTRTYVLDAARLTINANAAGGEIRAELLDATGEPIPGYTRADCAPVHADHVEVPVRWRGRWSLRDLAGRTVAVRFYLRDAELYGFTFARAPGDFDGDGDVDINDYARFQACYNGSSRMPSGADCFEPDLDGDTDVDVSDFAVFQACYNGAGSPPACE